MSASILLVDDDLGLLRSLGEYFERRGLEVHLTPSGREALQIYEAEQPDVVLLDLALPDVTGLVVLEELQKKDATVVMLTGVGDIATAVQAIKAGAENFLTKPTDLEHLSAVIDRSLEKTRLRRAQEYRRLRRGGDTPLDALGPSPRMRELAVQIDRIAQSDRTTVLLTGESGVGKGWVAERIHQLSPRSRGAFVDVNCATLTGSLLESELFGHEKGAFTEAKSMKRGLFEIAHGGTIFLDEICDLDTGLQPKLLKVLESRTFRRLGGVREIEVDVRVIAATNRDLQAAVRKGDFREDLLYRLAVMPMEIPPLRERSVPDLETLISRVLAELCRDFPRGPTKVGTETMALLVQNEWLGNVRELRNTLERARIIAGDVESLEPQHVALEFRSSAGSASSGLLQTLEDMEKKHIQRVLDRCGGNKTRAAQLLSVSRTTLYTKMKAYGLV